MKSEERQIRQAVAELGIKLTPDVKRQVKGVFDNITKKGACMKDVLGLNEKVTEGIYGQAYRLYNAGKYKEASQLFRLLIVLNGTESKYPMGLAACFHMLKEYAAAAELYTVSGLLDPQNPVPYYHASDCYLALGDKASAIMALEMAINRSKERPVFAQLKDRARLTMATLKEEMMAAQS